MGVKANQESPYEDEVLKRMLKTPHKPQSEKRPPVDSVRKSLKQSRNN